MDPFGDDPSSPTDTAAFFNSQPDDGSDFFGSKTPPKTPPTDPAPAPAPAPAPPAPAPPAETVSSTKDAADFFNSEPTGVCVRSYCGVCEGLSGSGQKSPVSHLPLHRCFPAHSQIVKCPFASPLPHVLFSRSIPFPCSRSIPFPCSDMPLLSRTLPLHILRSRFPNKTPCVIEATMHCQRGTNSAPCKLRCHGND